MKEQNQKFKILHERAQVLKQEIKKEDINECIVEGLIFLLGDEKYIIYSSVISEVLHSRSLTFLPCSLDFIAGIINIRGRIISVVDIKTFLGLNKTADAGKSKIIVLDNGEIEFGILADEIIGNVKINIEKLQKSTSFETVQSKGFIKGLTFSGEVVLNAEKIMRSKKIVVNEEV